MDVFEFSPLGVEQKSISSPQHIMIIDHHEIYRNGLRDLLNGMEGFQVVAEVGRYQDAITQVASIPVDILLIDLDLPDVQGIEVLHRLREVTPFPRLVLLIDTLQKDLLLEAMLAGASGFLTRDLLARDIVNALQGLQRGEFALSPMLQATTINLLIGHCRDLDNQLHIYPGSEARKTGSLRQDVAREVIPSPATIANHPLLSLLTSQECRVFQLMRQGMSNKQIAVQLSISPFTVGKHVQHILRKLGVMNRTQAASSVFAEEGMVLYR
jgi:two-component system response regulator DevR